MKKKIIGIFVITLLISISVIPLVGSIENVNKTDLKEKNQDKYCPCLIDEANCYAYSDQQSGTLYSEEIDLSNYIIPAEVTFDTYHEMTDPAIGYFEYSGDWDGVSPPGSATWIILGTYQGYGSPTDTYTIPDSGYVRFRYQYLSGSNDYGWMVDNFIVNDNQGTFVLDEDFESGAPDWQFTGGWYIRCIDCIDLNKTVFDPESNTWVDEVSACVGDEVRIRLKLCNCGERKLGLGHTVLYIWDTLPPCLEYVMGSSTPEEPTVNGNQLKWTFFDSAHDGLLPKDCIIIEFNVEVISTGQNKNCADAQIETDGGNVLHDSDCAIVNGKECGCIDPPNNLVAWWPFDEQQGIVSHDIIGTNDGIWHVNPTGPTPEINGKVDYGIRTGGWNCIKVDDDPLLNFGYNDFSIDCWIKHFSGQSNSYALTYLDKKSQNFPNTGYKLRQNDDNNLEMMLGNNIYTSSLNIISHQWNYIAATVDRTNNILTLYLNDASESFVLSNLGSLSNTEDLLIGKDHFSPYCPGRCIDELEIYNRCLNETEIMDIYHADSDGKCKKYVGKWIVSTEDDDILIDNINVDVGDTVQFKISAVNKGADILEDVEIIDTLPDCIEYIKGSSYPTEPTVEGKTLSWTYEYIRKDETKTIFFDALIAEFPLEPAQENLVEEFHGEGSLLSSDSVIINIGKTTPDLRCTDSLNLGKVEPGKVVKDIFTIENIGEEDSELNWYIASFPEWGTWSFKHWYGKNLKPEDGPVQVEVEVEAPEEKDNFNGEIKIINSNNPSDYEIITTTLSTPKSKEKTIDTPLFNFLENHPIIYQILQRILKL